MHAITASRQYEDREIAVAADGDRVGAWVWREQRPPVLSPLEATTPWSEGIQDALEEGIHALTLAPLSNGRRRLGILVFGFHAPFQPHPEALRFLERVASEVAATVDGHPTTQALRCERDRVQAGIGNLGESEHRQECLCHVVSDRSRFSAATSRQRQFPIGQRVLRWQGRSGAQRSHRVSLSRP